MPNSKLWQATHTVVRAIKVRGLEPARSDAEDINAAFDEYAEQIADFIREIITVLDKVDLCDKRKAESFKDKLQDAIEEIQREIEWRVDERIQERVT